MQLIFCFNCWLMISLLLVIIFCVLSHLLLITYSSILSLSMTIPTSGQLYLSFYGQSLSEVMSKANGLFLALILLMSLPSVFTLMLSLTFIMTVVIASIVALNLVSVIITILYPIHTSCIFTVFIVDILFVLPSWLIVQITQNQLMIIFFSILKLFILKCKCLILVIIFSYPLSLSFIRPFLMLFQNLIFMSH